MTIAVGVLASDGIVLAADTQVTIGENKVNQGKVRCLFCSDPVIVEGKWQVKDAGSMVLAGSGIPDTHVHNAAESIVEAFSSNKSAVGNELRTACQQTLSDFHAAHIEPYLGLPAIDRPSVEFLMAYSRGGKAELWRSNYAVVDQSHFYDAIGIGRSQAIGLFETLYRLSPLDLIGSAMLASLVVYRVKQTSIYCGNSTQIFLIRGNGFQEIHHSRVKKLEDEWDEYGRVVEAAGLRRLLGSPLDVDAPSDELHRRFQQMADELRDEIYC